MRTQLKRFIKELIVYIVQATLCITVLPVPFLQATSKKIRISSASKFMDNFHTVQAHALYRSKQLSARHLKKYIEKNKIRTIINLRGINKGSSWWHKEKAVAHKHGVKFYNISMTAKKLSCKENLLKLLLIYKHAPQPILIHCKSGVDRTGEAAALWVLEQQKHNKKKAFQQLSLWYGYIRSRRPAKYFLIKIWQNHNWLITNYNPIDYQIL